MPPFFIYAIFNKNSHSVERSMFKHLVGISIMLLCTHSYGQIYKWVDGHGNAHFSDEPPKNNTTFQTLNIPHSSRSSTPAPSPNSMSDDAIKQRQQKMLEVFEQERQAKKAKLEADLAKKRKELAETCKKGRSIMSAVRTGTLANQDKHGNKTVLPESERAAIEKRVQQSLKEHCD